ncbi:MAG: LysE family translocator [Rhodospirillales bacterium]|nr:LysE family translocator [Rhodospirillales bacterium]
MDFLSWFQVLTICALGAMSPGPSLAVVLRNTVSGGKRQGVLTGIGHGLGIYFYAGLVVTGLAVALAAAPEVETIISYAGVVLLVWLGYSFLGINRSKSSETPKEVPISGHGGFVSGFLIAFLNPKIAAFFLAVFSPFLRAEASVLEKTILAMTAGTVDTLWYVLVALVLSGSTMTKVLEKHSGTIERIIGIFLLFLAVGLVYRLL